MSEAASDKNKVREDPKWKDLTEEASKREDEEGTEMARQLENDDAGGVSGPDGDNNAENKVETSLAEDW